MRFTLTLFVCVAALASGCRKQSPQSSLQLTPTATQSSQGLFGEFCASLKNVSAAKVFSAAKPLKYIKGDDSHIIADGGYRILKQYEHKDCGNGSGVTIRFTDDFGAGMSGSEVFVKNSATNEIVGLALNDRHQEIAYVPEKLAHDKYGIGLNGKPTVYTRKGCFNCHNSTVDASNVFMELPGAEEFWKNAKYVSKFSSKLD